MFVHIYYLGKIFFTKVVLIKKCSYKNSIEGDNKVIQNITKEGHYYYYYYQCLTIIITIIIIRDQIL